jgi:hypothetical protein
MAAQGPEGGSKNPGVQALGWCNEIIKVTKKNPAHLKKHTQKKKKKMPDPSFLGFKKALVRKNLKITS